MASPKIDLNIPVNSSVKITTLKNGSFKGIVTNPFPKIKQDHYITLLNPIHKVHNQKPADDTQLALEMKIEEAKEKKRQIIGSYTIFQHEVAKVDIKALAKSTKKGPVRVPEKILDTVIVENPNQLDLVYTLLKDVREIGCMIEKLGVEGRFTNPELIKYIFLNINNTIIVISLDDVVGKNKYSHQRIQRKKEIWEGLEKHIFSNPKLLKVFFDTQATADYLYHKHSITLRNVFDLKMTDHHLRVTSNLKNGTKNGSKNGLHSGSLDHSQRLKEEKQITQLWEVYLPKYVSPYEVGLMTNNQIAQAPDFPHYFQKICALKVKYLLKLKTEIEKAIMRPLEVLLDCKNRQHLNSVSEVRKTFSSREEWDE